jgi:site-specific recombinase XerD
MVAAITRPLLDEVPDYFARHLARLPLSEHTVRSYNTGVRQFCEWLASQEHHRYEDVVSDSLSATHAVRDYRRHLLTERKRKPRTVNSALVAISAMYSWLEMPRPDADLIDVVEDDPKALDENQTRAVLRAAERRRGNRDLAIIFTMYQAGPRVAEVAALDIDDVSLATRVGEVQIRYGKGGKPRGLPLHAQAVTAIKAWTKERREEFDLSEHEGPLFVNRSGKRLTTRALGYIVTDVGVAAGIDLSPHVLRHTFLTRMARDGHDAFTLADLAGHKSIDTVRKYTRSRRSDRLAAIESLTIDY